MHNMKDEDAGYFKDSSQESMGIRTCYLSIELQVLGMLAQYQIYVEAFKNV